MSVPPDPIPTTRRPARATPSLDGRRRPLPVLAWPLVALAVVLALLAWRTDHRPGSTSTHAPGDVAAATRSVGELHLRVPASWRQLERVGDERATWGEPDRTHVVTLAATESSGEPLLAIVAQVARDARASMPGVEVVDGPTRIEAPSHVPHGDDVVRLQLRARTDAGPVDVVQVWRRDARAATDVVATWTSTDGRWPTDPADSIPEGS